MTVSAAVRFRPCPPVSNRKYIEKTNSYEFPSINTMMVLNSSIYCKCSDITEIECLSSFPSSHSPLCLCVQERRTEVRETVGVCILMHVPLSVNANNHACKLAKTRS